MNDPLSFIECRSKFIVPMRLSFDIVLYDDVIKVYYKYLPTEKKPWYGYHQSSKYGSGMLPLEKVQGKEKATPEAVAEALCIKLGAGKPKAIKNI